MNNQHRFTVSIGGFGPYLLRRTGSCVVEDLFSIRRKHRQLALPIEGKPLGTLPRQIDNVNVTGLHLREGHTPTVRRETDVMVMMWRNIDRGWLARWVKPHQWHPLLGFG